ncbi:uncharacterized protein RZ70_06580 [Apilactobacillus kunkeei]|uniref:GtrA family protein n=1 Tax=Apilactobacillus kunkeei TaxID=148814 RepID=UPI0006C65B20|nr:GtrA family protein [Apilactobacillus kunkeei]KOY73212.1 uncharacterized protein RZ70_06580 [Apilactobacillus kunkeei]
MINIIKQFFKFGIVGFINTVLTYLIYTCLWRITSPTFAMAIGYGTTTLIGLTINKKWVFKTSGNVTRTAIKYYSTYVFTWCLTVLLTYLLSVYTSINEQIVPVLTLIVTVPVNFILSKLWVFK